MNSTTPKSLPSALLFFVFLVAASARGADQEQPLQNPALKQFYSKLKIPFRRYYPQVTSHLLKDKIHFEYDTRVFIIHKPYMSGDWQDPWEERGPKMDGILCDIEFVKGRYNGQADSPQTFKGPYFNTLLLTPYSPKNDAHLHILLRYHTVKADFLTEFRKLADDFEKDPD